MSSRRTAERDAEIWKAVDELRQNSVGRLLLMASRRYNDEAMARVRELGHPDLTIAYAAVLPHIDIAGSRLTEIAERAGMSKQSASELINGLERLGYLKKAEDPTDKRAQRVCFTARGKAFLLAAYQAKRELEQELTIRLGRSGGEALESLLRSYVEDEMHR